MIPAPKELQSKQERLVMHARSNTTIKKKITENQYRDYTEATDVTV